MGFVYNNTWETFCKTYLELNGYFVLTNLFAALNPSTIDELVEQGLVEGDEAAGEEDGGAEIDQGAKRPSRRIEADLVAYRIPNTRLGDYLLDARSSGSDPFEFYAGDDNCEIKGKATDQNLLYVEVRANLALNSPEQQVKKMFDKSEGTKGSENRKIERMTSLLAERFNQQPLVVIMAYSVVPECLPEFKARGDRMYKEFDKMFAFMENRMRGAYDYKKSVMYNDPFLEFFRFLARREK